MDAWPATMLNRLGGMLTRDEQRLLLDQWITAHELRELRKPILLQVHIYIYICKGESRIHIYIRIRIALNISLYLASLAQCLFIFVSLPVNHGVQAPRAQVNPRGKPSSFSIFFLYIIPFTDGSYTKGTRAHTHRELIREWFWEPKGRSLEYI